MEKISLLTPPLLKYLVGNSHFLLSKFPPPTPKKIKITAEALGMEDIEAKTHLQRVSTLLQRRKKEISPQSIASTIEKRAIMPIGILRRRKNSKKTSIGLGNLHVNDWCQKRYSELRLLYPLSGLV